MVIRTKHVSEPATAADGTRVLVDRLWPRGRTKASLPIDYWHREIAPSTTLRQWFQHDPDKWVEFQRRYRQELATNQPAMSQLLAFAGRGTLTLVFGASDRKHNNAVALAAMLGRRTRRARSTKGT